MSYRLPPEAAGYQAKGLVVTGVSPHCGKTVACAGIAGALGQLGFKAQAFKPLNFTPAVSIRGGHEQAFFNKIVPPVEQGETLTAPTPQAVGNADWQRLLETCRKRVYPYILEAPGNVASPIRYLDDQVLDTVDLAKALDLPLLLVSARQPDAIGTLAPIFAYLWHRDANVIGWISVETQPTQTPAWETEVLYLNHLYKTPYLGEIAYSPSISVEALQQGNLIRTTEMGVDLLPIQQALDLMIP